MFCKMNEKGKLADEVCKCSSVSRVINGWEEKK